MDHDILLRQLFEAGHKDVMESRSKTEGDLLMKQDLLGPYSLIFLFH